MTPTEPIDLIQEAWIRGVRLFPLDGELTVIAPVQAADVACRIYQQRDEVLSELHRLGYYGPPGPMPATPADFGDPWE